MRTRKRRRQDVRLRESGLYSKNFLIIPKCLFYKIKPKVRGGKEEEPASPSGKSRPDPKWWWPSQSCWQVRFFFSRPFFFSPIIIFAKCLSSHLFLQIVLLDIFFANCHCRSYFHAILQFSVSRQTFQIFCNFF